MISNTTRRAVPGAIPVIAAVPDAPFKTTWPRAHNEADDPQCRRARL